MPKVPLSSNRQASQPSVISTLQRWCHLRIAAWSEAHADNATVDLQQSGDADAVMFPEIGVALVSGEAAAEHGLTTAAFAEEDAYTHSVDPEYLRHARPRRKLRSPRRRRR
jgi:hypothetical protein